MVYRLTLADRSAAETSRLPVRMGIPYDLPPNAAEQTSMTNAVAEKHADISPAAKARIAGGLYLLTIVAGGLAETFGAGQVAWTDATVTASNILAHESLFRLGFALYVIEMACNVAMTAVMYDLLKPVSKNMSLLAAFFSLVATIIKTTSRLFYIAPLMVLSAPAYLDTFSAGQLRALALLCLKVNALGAGISMVFFGLYALFTGYLVMRSTFLPRILGVLGAIGGFCWLAFLSPPFGLAMYGYIVPVVLVGAAAKIVWLLVFGVNEARWREQAAVSAQSIWA